MNEIHDGGQAFPRATMETIDGVNTGRFDGMTLRDYFAGQALAGWCVDTPKITVDHVVSADGKTIDRSINSEEVRKVAAHCYRIADAMIAERFKP